MSRGQGVPPLQLLPLTAELVRDLERGAPLEPRWGASAGEERTLVTEVAQRTEAYLDGIGAPAPWRGFLAIDPASGLLVGSCSFKGGPDGEGAVEIAYFTFPRFERRGFGTAMAAALVERAFREGARSVIAHTLPQPSASTRILERTGFSFAGPAQDPDEGPVWKWRALAKPAH